ncbi:FG-GAP-like repeat-containing protein [Streptomyces lavendulocolor]|uniref:FG-GAP-like repeat-containing protein n=1 Tax=Streptomyces lavendulocolor TaxID=67316 RepID=UPI0031D62CCB
MPRRALVRHSAAVAAAVTLASGAGPLAPAAVADDAPGVVFGATEAAHPRSVIPLSAGPTGYLRYEEGRGHFRSTYTGTTTPVYNEAEGPEEGATYGAGSDVIAALGTGPTNAGRVRLFDPAGGTNTYIDVPAGHRYVGTYGSTVVTYTRADSTAEPEWHTHRLSGGTVGSTQVTGWPAGAERPYRIESASADGLVTSVRQNGVTRPVWIGDGQVRALARTTTAATADTALTPDHVLEWTVDGKLAFYARTGATAGGALAQTRVADLPYQQGAQLLGLIGDRAFVARPSGLGGTAPYRVVSVPLSGGAETTVLAYARAHAAPTPDGTRLLLVGGDSAGALGVQLVGVTDSGPTVEQLTGIRPMTSMPRSFGFANGKLYSLERMPDLSNAFRTRTVSVTGALTAGATEDLGALGTDLTDCTDSTGCPEITATGDGRLLIRPDFNHGQFPLLVQPGGTQGTPVTAGLARLEAVDASGRYLTAHGDRADGSYTGLITVDLDTGRQLASLPAVRALDSDLYGDTVWAAGEVAGTVKGYDVRTGAVKRTVNLGSGCKAESIKVTAHWLSWDCAGWPARSGVFDLDKNVNHPTSEPVSELGDGYVVWGNGSDVKVTDIRGAQPVHVATHRVADDNEREYKYAVDPATGRIALTATTDGDIRVVDAGVPASPIARIDADVPAAQDVKGGGAPWKPRWWLSKPAASWQLTVKDGSGAVRRTLTGGEARGVLGAAWDGKDASGAAVADGAYTWTLTALPADGQGAALTQSGTVTLSGATVAPVTPPARRDHNGDRVGDLVSLSSTGTLAVRYGTGAGTLSGAVSGSGWSTSAVAVPFGDLNGDRCNDVLVRLPSGELRAYRPGCGKALVPTAPYTSLGTAWAQFNVLTSPGDLTGDGRADLVARQATTGDMYLYADDGAGRLKARGRIATNWKAYRAVFGAGDLNGDGAGDLLAVDGANSLWRMNGTAAGTLTARVLALGNNWAAGRNAFVGVGDLNKDGKADLLSRNAAGDLLRNNGNGAGSFGSTVKLGTGWQGYRGLF